MDDSQPSGSLRTALFSCPPDAFWQRLEQSLAKTIVLLQKQEGYMLRGFILWLLGVPLIGIIILYLLGYL
jgi:hypothetical protein